MCFVFASYQRRRRRTQSVLNGLYGIRNQKGIIEHFHVFRLDSLGAAMAVDAGAGDGSDGRMLYLLVLWRLNGMQRN